MIADIVFEPASMSNNNRHSSLPNARRASLLLRLLAIGLLLFAQLSFAGHYHDEAELSVHDCAVCLQLHTVKNTPGSTSQPALLDHVVALNDPRSTALSLPAFNVYLPPCRAPPLY